MVEKMPSAKTKHSQNDLGRAIQNVTQITILCQPKSDSKHCICASVHGLFLLLYVTWNYCCDLAPFHQGWP